MSDSMLLAGAIALAAGLAGVFAVRSLAPRIHAARHNAWRRFARRHRLKLRRDANGAGRMDGALAGRPLTVRRPDSGTDAQLLGLASVRLELTPRRPPPRGLSVVNAGESVGRVAHLIDAQVTDPAELKLADPGFHMVVRESDSATGALHYLTPLRRQALQRLADRARSAGAGIEQGRLFWESRDPIEDLEYLEQCCSILQETAERLESADDAPDLPSPFTKAGEGRTA